MEEDSKCLPRGLLACAYQVYTLLVHCVNVRTSTAQRKVFLLFEAIKLVFLTHHVCT